MNSSQIYGMITSSQVNWKFQKILAIMVMFATYVENQVTYYNNSFTQ